MSSFILSINVELLQEEAGFSFIGCVILVTFSTKDALPKFALFPSAANEFCYSVTEQNWVSSASLQVHASK